jgi:P-type Cu+ transporter
MDCEDRIAVRERELAVNAADVIVVLVAVAPVAGLVLFGPRRAHTARVEGGVQRAVVTVRGGYSTDRIRVSQNVPAEIVFDRQESGDCTSRVVFDGLGVSAALPAFTRTVLFAVTGQSTFGMVPIERL